MPLTTPRDPTTVLRAVVEGTARTTGRDFFSTLVRRLAEALEVRYCFVAECVDQPPTRARTLAFWDGEKLVPDFTYEIRETPCRRVLEGETCAIGERVRELFPDDLDLVDLGAESYVAVPIYGGGGELVGHLAALDTEPIDPNGVDLSLLRIFADRAGAELDRQRAEAERQRLSEQVLRSQKLESLAELAGSIADDLNNILMGIFGNAVLTLRELSPVSPIRPHVEDIEHAARRAAELAQQMLAFSGKGRFVTKTFQLGELIREMAAGVRASLPPQTRLELALDPGVPPIRADVQQMRQLVEHLVRNASEALDGRDGTVSLRLDTVDADADTLAACFLDEGLSVGRYLRLVVSDDGPGIDEGVRAKIFDPFFTTKAARRGLGLSAVLGIVRGHRGAIQVTSTPGRGSSFAVLLPAAT